MINYNDGQNGSIFYANERIRQLESENFQLQEQIQRAENEIRIKEQRMLKLQSDTDESRKLYQELLPQVVDLKVSNSNLKEKSSKMQNEFQKKILDLQAQLSELRTQIQDKDLEMQKIQANSLKEHENNLFLQTSIQKISSLLSLNYNNEQNKDIGQILQAITNLLTPKPTTSRLTQTNINYKTMSTNTETQYQQVISPPIVINPPLQTPIIPNQNIDSISSSSYSPIDKPRKHSRRSRKPEIDSEASSVRRHGPQSESYIHQKRRKSNDDAKSELSRKSDPRFRFDRIDSDIGTDIPLEKIIQMHKRLRIEEENSIKHSRYK